MTIKHDGFDNLGDFCDAFASIYSIIRIKGRCIHEKDQGQTGTRQERHQHQNL